MGTTQRDASRQSVLSFDRTDMRITRVLLGLTAVLCCVIWVVLPVLAWTRGEAMLIDCTTQATVVAPALDQLGYAYWPLSDTLTVRVDHPSVSQRLLGLTNGLLLAVTITVGVALAMRVVNAVLREEGFTPAFVRTLRQLAIFVGIAALACPTLQALIAFMLAGSLELGTGPMLSVTLDGWAWLMFLVGAFLGLLAEVANRGRSLQDDVAGLV